MAGNPDPSRKVGLVIGAVIALVGVLLLSGATSMSTVTWPGVGEVSPSGTSSAPTLIVPGGDVNLRLSMPVGDSYGMDLKGYQSWNVTAKLNPDKGPATAQSVRLAFVTVTVLPLEGGAKRGVALYQAHWTVPYEAGGASYRIDWTVYSGSDRIAAKISYAEAQANEPDGSFMVEGKVAEDSSQIVLTDPSVSFEFVPTMWAENIEDVRIEIWHEGAVVETVDLAEIDGAWAADCELPEPGAYGLKGYVDSRSGNTYTMLDAVAEYDAGSEEPYVDPFTGEGLGPDGTTMTVGALLILFGAVVMAFSIRRKR